jgi:hypothetical protein
MRYSQLWDLTPRQALDMHGAGVYDRQWDGPFARLHGRAHSKQWFLGGTVTTLEVEDCGDPHTCILARLRPETECLSYRKGSQVGFVGRLVLSEVGPRQFEFFLDTRRGRFHGASVTGLAVGAMGVAVFAMYLWTWLRERKAAA